MKKHLMLLGLAAASSTFAATINLDTGVADWMVSGPGVSGTVAAVVADTGGPQDLASNGTWAPAPTGSSWISWGTYEGTSCLVGQTPGNGCASTLFATTPYNGDFLDIWFYSLTISAAQLGGYSYGNLNFVWGGDNRAFIIRTEGNLLWGNPSPGDGYSALACSSNTPGSDGFNAPTAGNTQASYNNCVTTISFGPGDLNPVGSGYGAGSLTLTVQVDNDEIPGCLSCGDPTGFVLAGTVTGTPPPPGIPEPATFGLVGVAILGLLVFRRKLAQA